MFAYVLIALELSILYLAFWHYFLRDVKNYKVTGPLWGVYEDHINELSKKRNTNPVLIFSENGAQFVGNNSCTDQAEPNDAIEPTDPSNPRHPRTPGNVSSSGSFKQAA